VNGGTFLRIIGLVCSPRRNGNTEILISEALEEAGKNGAETEIIRTTDMNILPCDGCAYCHNKGKCRIDDDMQGLYNKMLKADGIILGSPVYFWSVSGQAKILMDRTYALRYPHHRLKNKPAGAIVVAGRRGCISALSAINNFFLGQDMLPTGLGIAGYGNQKGEVLEDTRAVDGARSLGRQIVDLIKILGRGQPQLETESHRGEP
jgi:multimeric flavodoxin WrbA